MRPRPAAFLMVLLVSAGAAGDSSSDSSSPRFFTVVQGERVELTLDGVRIALRVPAGRVREGLSGLDDSTGLSALSGAVIERAMPGGWTVVRLTDAIGADTVHDVFAGASRSLGGDAFVSPVFVGEDGSPVIPTAQVLVRFREGVDRAARIAAIDAAGLAVLDEDWARMTGAYRLQSPARNGLEVLAQTRALADAAPVIFAEPDMLFTGSGGVIPSDFYFDLQWGMRNTGQDGGAAGMDINAAQAWDITLGTPGVRVLVIDAGVDPGHDDLLVAGGADFTNDPGANGGAPVNQWDVHGTAVAGCMTALLNDEGVVGVAPLASLYSARPFISNSTGGWNSQASWTVEALAWAEGLGVRVSNNSNRYGFISGAITSMYAQTRENGMVHFASGGNEYDNQLTYPARLSTVNGVAAVGSDGMRADFSNQSAALAFAGPGVDVLTTDGAGNTGYIPGDWVYVDGTSFASPHAAGIAALMLSVRPDLTPDEITWIMQSTAMDLAAPGFDNQTGWGMVRAYPAVIADVPLPTNFVRSFPEDGATDRPRDSMVFGWSRAEFTNEYDFSVYRADSDEKVACVLGVAANSLTFDLGTLTPGISYRWEVAARNTQGSTVAVSGPAHFVVLPRGDVSGDCAVNFADLNLILSVFGQSGSFADLADINGDGIVNFADLNVVLSTFGESCD